jgi:hypothetical protein
VAKKIKKRRKRPSYPQIFSPFLAASTKKRESIIFNNLLKDEDRKEGRKGTQRRRYASCLPQMMILEGAHDQRENLMKMKDPGKEGRRMAMVTRARRPQITRNGSRTRVGKRRKVTRAGRPGVTGNGSLTRVGRRRSQSIEGVIKLLSLILRGNEWHTILLLVPLIEILGVGKGRRWRRALEAV